MTYYLLKPPRFPIIAAMLCSACIGAAVWLPVKYWTVWEGTAEEFAKQTVDVHAVEEWQYRYVHVQIDQFDHDKMWSGGLWTKRQKGYQQHSGAPWPALLQVRLLGPSGYWAFRRRSPTDGAEWLTIDIQADADSVIREMVNEWKRGDVVVSGRIVPADPGDINIIKIDTSLGRFHSAGIAGPIVGVMGVFVFIVALRHWLGERRKFREETGGITPAWKRVPSEC